MNRLDREAKPDRINAEKGLAKRWRLQLRKGSEKRELFLEGNILKGVLTVCVPMAAFQLLNELFRVFDLAITARINPESVAAVSFSTS